MNVCVIILAAGQGTRMKSDLAKVMHPLAGRPMVRYVVDTARTLDPCALVTVVGHGAEQVRAALGEETDYAVQSARLGTGDAVWRARAAAEGRAATVLVLYGDTPLIRPETLRAMAARHEAEAAAVTLLTFRPDNPAGYGRILRDAAGGRVVGVVEDREATAEQRAIGEVNSGILCFRDGWLWPNLAGLMDRGPRSGGEFYLTDLVDAAHGQGEPIIGVPVADATEVIGLDNRLKLALAGAELRRRINERWLLAGVTMTDPAATYIEPGVEIGAETVIWPNTVLQGRTRIGRGCTLGPGTVIRDSTIGPGCRVELSVVEGAVVDEGSQIGPFGHVRAGGKVA